MDVQLPMYLNGDGQSFELKKFGVVSLEASYAPPSIGDSEYLRTSDVSDAGIVSQDLANQKLRFGFTGTFVVDPVVDSDNENGRVVGWKYRFNATVKSQVYKWPNLEIAYWEDPIGGSPSPGGVSSTPTPTPTSTPTPQPEKVVAKFVFEEPVVEFGDTNYTLPAGSSVSGAGCSIKEAIWTVSQNGNSITYKETGQVTPTALGGFPSKPSWLTTGTVTVTLKIVSTCGGEATDGPKTYEIITPPSCSGYNPNLDFNIGFVDHGNRGAWEAITTAVPGEYLDLQVLEPRPDAEPPTGTRKKTIISWDWAGAITKSNWLKRYFDDYQPNTTLEEYYSFPYSMILTDAELGTHSIKATRTDVCGDSNTRTATLTVVPPNPVAVIKGQKTVKEARPITEPFDSSLSYSPVRGRGINHSRDEWGNKQAVYYTPGIETITLKVWDTAGLPSLNTAVHYLTVLPDEPPIALGKAQTKAIRGVDTVIKDASYSNDGDPLLESELWRYYDANNNGNYDDDGPPQRLYFGAGKTITENYSLVGKYRYRIRAVEDTVLQKEDTSYFYVEVVNDSPWVSFEMSSEVKEPMVIPTVPVSLNPADWNATSTISDKVKKNWGLNADGSLSTYWSYFNSRAGGYWAGSNGSPRALSTRTSDPTASQYIGTAGPSYQSWEGSNDSIATNSYYVDGQGTIFVQTYNCPDCGNPEYVTVSFKNLAGETPYVNYPATLNGFNIFADEVSIYEGYPLYRTAVYKLSSMFTTNHVLLRVNSPLTPGPAMQNMGGYYNFTPPTLSDYTYTAGGYTWNGDTGRDSAGNSVKSNDATYIRKVDKNNNILWSVDNRYWNGNLHNEYVLTSIFYNLDETKVFAVGQHRVYDFDNEGNLSSSYWKATMYDSNTGAVLSTANLPNVAHQNSTDSVFVFEGKLYIISGTGEGLFVYDDNLNLIKRDASVPIGGIVTGDGFLRYTKYPNPMLYDLRNYTFMPMGSTPYQMPVEYFHEFNHSVYGSGIGNDVFYSKLVPYDRVLTTHSQLINPSLPSISSFNINFKYKYQEDNYLSMNNSGMAFKIQDRRNMYRLEFNNSKIRLVKIVEGNRTVLHTQDYSFDKGSYYSFRIRSNENKHTIYVNGVPLFDVTDSTFQAGSFGPSTDFFNVSFKDLTYQDLSSASGSSLTKDTVIVDQAIQYALTFEDTENDPHPLDLTWWRFAQTEPWKFLDAGDGKTGWSGMNGSELHGYLPSLDRVGVWRVTHWLKDDPHPDYPYPSGLFDNYRAESNRYSRNIIVHRRPNALFTLWMNEDGTVGWNEQSYDPDRWLSAWNYSTESPVYATNRGIYARKYKYITPSGLELEGKLTRPAESGVYTVSEAVMDEYGAWSDWYDQQITATIILPPNKVPVVDFESPRYVYRDDLNQLVNHSYDPDGDPMSYKWTVMKPPYESILSYAQHPDLRIRDRGLGKDAVSPTWFITLEATDSKGETGSKTKPLTVLNQVPTTSINGPSDVLINQTHGYTSGGDDLDSEDRWNLSYYWKVTAPDGTETDHNGSSSITLIFSQGGTYKLEHRVIDPVGDSSNVAQLLVNVDDNKPPIPDFTIAPNPAYRGEQVSITSTASDPDGIIVRHDYWITGPDNVEQHWTTDADWSRTYGTLGNYTIRQRVEDNKGASAETSQTLQVVNRPPTVELTTPSGQTPETPSVNIPPFRAVWSYADGDGDPQQSWHFRIYEYGTNVLKMEGTGNNAADGFDVGTGMLVGGVTYYAVVTASDGYASVASAPKYFILNRPPVADFDWTPKPVWEGDRITLFSLSHDPDGDELTYQWRIIGPSGQEWSGSLPEWTGVWMEPGSYAVTLTVSDGMEYAAAQKQVEVLPLTIEAELFHTPQWLAYHLEHGHETTRAPKDFYAGEKLLAQLVSAPAPVETAEAWLDAAGIGGGSIRVESMLSAEAGNPRLFTGELYDPVMGSLDNRLPDGLHEVHFRLTYSNGVVKETAVPFRIIGSALGTVGVHRVQ